VFLDKDKIDDVIKLTGQSEQTLVLCIFSILVYFKTNGKD
jgi:hypothetical protein